MKRLLCSILILIAACGPDENCRRQVDAQGKTMVVCQDTPQSMTPEQPNTPTDDPNAPVQPTDPSSPDVDPTERPTQQTSTTNRRYRPCEIVSKTVLCDNNVRGTLPDTPDEGTQCKTVRLPGASLRIACVDKDGQSTIILPDGPSVPVTCTRHRASISCDDGSFSEDKRLDDPNHCQNPRLIPYTDEEYQRAFDCLEQCTYGPCDMCTLETKIACEDQTQVQTPIGCYFPQGVVHIDDNQSAQNFLNRKCEVLHADLIFKPKDDATPIDARLLRALLYTRLVSGSLIIEQVDLPANQVDLEQYKRIKTGLAIVGGDVQIRQSKRVPAILFDAPLYYVGGTLSVEAHQDLHTVFFEHLKIIRGDVLIASNYGLELIDLHEDLKIDGRLILANNPLIDPCELIQLVLWGWKQADGVVVISNSPVQKDINCH